jgi:hypothetical protein
MAQQGPPPPPRPQPLYVLPKLFDERIDKEHWSYLFIFNAELGTVRARAPSHYMMLHPSWVPKYVIFFLCIR